jgi:hypothetical protein
VVVHAGQRDRGAGSPLRERRKGKEGGGRSSQGVVVATRGRRPWYRFPVTAAAGRGRDRDGGERVGMARVRVRPGRSVILIRRSVQRTVRSASGGQKRSAAAGTGRGPRLAGPQKERQ